MKRFWIGIPGLLAFLLVGCGSDAPPGARVTKTITLDSALTRMQNVQLLRTGADFVLVGYENGRVAWGRLSEAGELTGETGFALPEPVLGPFFTAVKKAAPGDQLITVVVNQGVDGGFQLQGFVHNPGDLQATGPVVLSVLPGGVTKDMIRVSAGVAQSGNVGLVTWGFQGQGVAPKYRFLGPDATLLGEEGKIGDAAIALDVVKWDCLKILQTGTPLGIALAYPFEQTDGTIVEGTYGFERFELGETSVISDTPMQLQASVKACQITGAPTSDGYAMAWKNDSGIFAGRLYNPVGASMNATVITHMVLATTQFSTPKDIPTPVFISPVGPDSVLGLSRETGPLISRFSYDGAAHGSSLVLPSATGKTSPMVGWVGPSKTFVTYADVSKVAPFAVTKRYFLQVEFPATL